MEREEGQRRGGKLSALDAGTGGRATDNARDGCGWVATTLEERSRATALEERSRATALAGPRGEDGGRRRS
jgi:hypothetical protein